MDGVCIGTRPPSLQALMKGSYTAAKLTIVTVGSMPPIAAFEVSLAVVLLWCCMCAPVLQKMLPAPAPCSCQQSRGLPAGSGICVYAGRGAHTAGRDCHGV